MTATSIAPASSFGLARPLDWFQLRALLWEIPDRPNCWEEAAEAVNARCPLSARVSGETLSRVRELLSKTHPQMEGTRIWAQILYSSVHQMFSVKPIFMNLGYLGEIEGLDLDQEDQQLFPFIALYRVTLSGVDCTDRDVVDVGCGAGGGCRHIRKYLSPRSVTGVDLVNANIAECLRGQMEAGLAFLQGDAEDLPLESQSADVILSVESSHSYHSVPAFLGEINRVLRPGGVFAFTDHRPLDEEWGERRTMAALTKDLAESHLAIEKVWEITDGVARCSEAIADFKEEMLSAAHLSDAEASHLREILHCRGSNNFEKVRSGAWAYKCWHLRKGY